MDSFWVGLIHFLLSFLEGELNLSCWALAFRFEAAFTHSLKLCNGPYECLLVLNLPVNVFGENCGLSLTVVFSGMVSKTGEIGFLSFSWCTFLFRILIFFFSMTFAWFYIGYFRTISSVLYLRCRGLFLLCYTLFCFFFFVVPSSDSSSSGIVMRSDFLGDLSSDSNSSLFYSGFSMASLSSNPLSSGISVFSKSWLNFRLVFFLNWAICKFIFWVGLSGLILFNV